MIKFKTVWDVYGKTGGNNALHFWRYVNDLLFQQCSSPFSQNCTYSIMDIMDIGSNFIERCMNHTNGLLMDDDNGYLQYQIDQGQELTMDDIPTLKINNTWYAGDYTTAAIFETVCAAYPDSDRPVACDFCQNCNNVRYCLWYLQCDGKTFEEFATEKLDKERTDAPTIAPTSENTREPLASTSTAESASTTNTGPTGDEGSQAQKKSSNEKDTAEASLIRGILVGLAVGMVVTVYYGWKDYQARLVLQQMMLEYGKQVVPYKDDSLDVVYKSPRGSNSIMKVRFNPAVESVEYNDNVGGYKDNVSDTRGLGHIQEEASMTFDNSEHSSRSIDDTDEMRQVQEDSSNHSSSDYGDDNGDFSDDYNDDVRIPRIELV